MVPGIIIPAKLQALLFYNARYKAQGVSYSSFILSPVVFHIITCCFYNFFFNSMTGLQDHIRQFLVFPFRSYKQHLACFMPYFKINKHIIFFYRVLPSARKLIQSWRWRTLGRTSMRTLLGNRLYSMPSASPRTSPGLWRSFLTLFKTASLER